MGNKRFDPELNAKHDANGKRLAKEIMEDLFGAKFLDENTKETAGNFSDGFWDQRYLRPDGTTLLVEPEMKDSKWWGTGWNSTPFKYTEMDIPYRKKKNKADLFMVISTCENYAWVVSREAMDKHLNECMGGKPKVKSTKYEFAGGEYYSTPVGKGRFVHKKDGKWHPWKN